MGQADDIGLGVRRIFAEVLERDSILPHAELATLGIDSMAMIDINVRIEAEWGIEMPDLDELGRSQITTLDQLIEIVRNKVAS